MKWQKHIAMTHKLRRILFCPQLLPYGQQLLHLFVKAAALFLFPCGRPLSHDTRDLRIFDFYPNFKNSQEITKWRRIIHSKSGIHSQSVMKKLWLSSRIVSDNPWTSPETCDMIGTADSGTERRAEILKERRMKTKRDEIVS